jgi:small-conductance mechanosensitive channel
MELFEHVWTNPWFIAPAAVIVAIVLALIAHRMVFLAIARAMPRRLTILQGTLQRRLEKPSLYVLPALAVFAVIPVLPLPDRTMEVIDYVSGLGAIAVVGWAAAVGIAMLEDIVTAHYRIEERDNLRARQIKTQSHILRRVANVIIFVVTAGLMLMTIPAVRHLGVSLFASAGIAGIVIGMAARPALSNLIAGLQVALTEPIRLDDVVIVEGEFGWIEEIGTSFVVVRVWDKRRIVLPLSYFIEKPFQNWTRKSADLLGTVYLHTDYRVPLDDMRAELDRILEATPFWDKQVKVIQVTEATEKTMELRVLVSAIDAPTLWNLRVLVREKLIAWLQREHPDSLPRDRQENIAVRHPGDKQSPATGSDAGQPRLPFAH